MPARGGDGDPRVNRVRCVYKALRLSIGPSIAVEGAPGARRLEGEWGDSAARRGVPAARGCRFAAGPAIPASIGALQMGARCKSFAHLGRFTASPLADRGRVRHGEGKVDNKDER